MSCGCKHATDHRQYYWFHHIAAHSTTPQNGHQGEQRNTYCHDFWAQPFCSTADHIFPQIISCDCFPATSFLSNQLLHSIVEINHHYDTCFYCQTKQSDKTNSNRNG